MMKVQINTSVDDYTLDKINKHISEIGMTRSDWIRSLIRRELRIPFERSRLEVELDEIKDRLAVLEKRVHI